jgi:hypothetical protein
MLGSLVEVGDEPLVCGRDAGNPTRGCTGGADLDRKFDECVEILFYSAKRAGLYETEEARLTQQRHIAYGHLPVLFGKRCELTDFGKHPPDGHADTLDRQGHFAGLVSKTRVEAIAFTGAVLCG